MKIKNVSRSVSVSANLCHILNLIWALGASKNNRLYKSVEAQWKMTYNYCKKNNHVFFLIAWILKRNVKLKAVLYPCLYYDTTNKKFLSLKKTLIIKILNRVPFPYKLIRKLFSLKKKPDNQDLKSSSFHIVNY